MENYGRIQYHLKTTFLNSFFYATRTNCSTIKLYKWWYLAFDKQRIFKIICKLIFKTNSKAMAPNCDYRNNNQHKS